MTEVDVGGMWEPIWLYQRHETSLHEKFTTAGSEWVMVRGRTTSSLLPCSFLPWFVCLFLSVFLAISGATEMTILVVRHPVTFLRCAFKVFYKHSASLSSVGLFSLVCRRFCTWYFCQFVWSRSDWKRQIKATQILKTATRWAENSKSRRLSTRSDFCSSQWRVTVRSKDAILARRDRVR